MYRIVEKLPNGCVMIANEDGGCPFLETGDSIRAKKLLTAEDYAEVKEWWTPDRLALRHAELDDDARQMIALT